jgi:enoyl-CoA hydratase/carnithine racemase
VVEALERDNFMDPEQAKEWGLIDEIVESRVAMGGATARKVDGSQPRFVAKYAIVMAAGLI